ncbi:unnamed protein product [Penicillium viridicatum]
MGGGEIRQLIDLSEVAKSDILPSTMSHPAEIQQATENIHTMFPGSDNVDTMSNETLVDSYRSLDPSRASLGDYNRSMLQYTQRQMSSFVDTDDLRRDSESSGQSDRSIASSGSNISRQANESFTPVSNTSHLAETKVTGRDMA